MPRSRSPFRSLVLFAAALSLAVTAHAASFQPLTPGNFWEYAGSGGGHHTETITGMLVLHGRAVAVRTYSGGIDDGLMNFWLLDTNDGSVLLAGFNRPDANLALVYEPPIRCLPVPPVVGPQPTQNIVAHDLFTDVVVTSFPIRFEVLEDVSLTVPAGTFHAFGTGQVAPLPAPAAAARTGFGLDGRRLPAASAGITSATPSDWYSEGVGVVQFQSSELFQLVGYGQPTPVARSSWAAIKRLFR